MSNVLSYEDLSYVLYRRLILCLMKKTFVLRVTNHVLRLMSYVEDLNVFRVTSHVLCRRLM